MSLGIDQDTARKIQTGRETVGDLLVHARDQLRKVFIVFVLGLMGTIMVLRLYVWDFLRENTKSRMARAVSENVDVIARNPFDVILIQVKIGLFVGIALAIPLIVYYSRDALRRRGVESVVPLSRWKVAAFGGMATGLFGLGVFYAYAVFFPFMFSFLASNALSAGIKPSYDIVMYVQFLLLLTLSFGIAAQLPLLMSALTYTEIVPYEFFRDKWRYAVVLIFVFGAVFSPPDPFTQVMWGIPLVGLYAFSLGLAKVTTNIRRRGKTTSGAETMKAALARIGVLFVVSTVGSYLLTVYDGLGYVNRQVLPQIPAIVRPEPLTVEGFVGVSGPLGEVLFGVFGGSVVVFVALMITVARVLREPVVPRGPTSGGKPADIDVGELDAAGVRAAPPEAFAEMTEEQALTLARRAIDEGNKEKGRAILDRFDEAEEVREEKQKEEAEAEKEPNVFATTAAGMFSAFSEDEKTEEDIGGYYYDIRFILDSLTSKMFRLVGLFMFTVGATFYWLYQGGLGQAQNLFLSRLSYQVLGALSPEVPFGDQWYVTGTHLLEFLAARQRADPSFVVALHPVEHIVFEVKVSVIVGVIFTLPLVMYYVWPALRERGLITEGNRNVFLVWGGSLIVGVIGGSLFGFFFVAPSVISFLVEDTLRAGIAINYRLNAFLWLVLYTTAGIGVLAEIPVTMFLFDRGGIVSYETMHRYSREVIFAVFVGLAFLTPAGVLLLFLTAIPIAIAYAFGLFVLWFLTLPRRVRRDGLRGVWPS